jgi:hypothetical protein
MMPNAIWKCKKSVKEFTRGRHGDNYWLAELTPVPVR